MEVPINGARYKMILSEDSEYITLAFTGLDTYCFQEVTLEVTDEPFTAEELIAEIQLIQEKPEVYNFG